MAVAPGNNLINVTIATPSLIWNRSLVVLSTAIPDLLDLNYYYNTLLGLGATVTFEVIPVPLTFHTALLPAHEAVPTRFPSHNLETSVDDTVKREAYGRFIQQMCEMEKCRAMLYKDGGGGGGGGAAPAAHAAAAPTAATTMFDEPVREDLFTRRANKSREWVNKLLRSINKELGIEEEDEPSVSAAAGDALEVCAQDDYTPIGWIFTPVVSDIRRSRGSRIVMDSVTGAKWERLLGTELYPDMIVSRRLSAVNWAFQHPAADALIKSTLEWYMATQDTSIRDGISGWIPQAEYEINSLFSTFKRIKIHERLLEIQVQKMAAKPGRIYKFLHQVESQLLASSTEHAEIVPCTADMFLRYMYNLYRVSNVEKDAYIGNESVLQNVQRWARGNLGFRAGVDPLVDSWKPMWDATLRGSTTPTSESVNLFLRTLVVWDPIEALSLSNEQRNILSGDWVNCYFDNEIVINVKEKVLSTVLHIRCREWCSKFLPISTFQTQLSPMIIGPVFGRRGHPSIRRYGGRLTAGIQFKNPDLEVPGGEVGAADESGAAKSAAKPAAKSATKPKKSRTTTAPSSAPPINVMIDGTGLEVDLGNL